MRVASRQLGEALVALGVSAASANQQGWATTVCPSCAIERPSLRVNVNTGEYRCFRCNASSGPDGQSIDEFVRNPRAVGSSHTRRTGSDLPALTPDLIARYHRLMMDSPGVIDDLAKRRGWTKQTVERLTLGWDGSHVWIPIKGLDGNLVNARLYDPFKRTAVKSFHYANSDGLRRTSVWVPFGPSSIEGSDEIWMFEGEPDAILAAQLGFPTAVVTGGAGTWTDEILEVVGQRRSVLCYDMDAPGRRGGRVIRARLEAHDRRAVLIEFRLSEQTSKDFSDAILKESKSAAWFKEIAAAAWSGASTDNPGDPRNYVPVKLGGGVPGEPVSVKAHVLGGSTVPMLVPHTVESRCRMDWNPDRCGSCPAQRANGMLRSTVEPESRELLQLVASTSKQQEFEYRRIAGVPGRCPNVRFTITAMWQVQTLKLIPPMSERSGGDSTIRAAVHVSSADGRPPAIKANQIYQFLGQITPDVLSNEWTLLSADASPAEDDIDSFRVDSTLVEMLSTTFRPTEWTVEAVDRSLTAEEKSMSRHVTRVYGRDDLLRLIDLTYHSVLQFQFRGRVTQRGWLSTGILGDTRVGKSETAGAYVEHLGLGKYVMDPANTTYAGLVGGLQQVGSNDKSWTVTWGLIPTNDRGLVIIDEISSLSVDDIGRMSGMRSSGIAELTKIRNSSTMARTRLIAAGNPRGQGKTLASFSTAIEGFMELIGAPEDVARFDMAMAVPQGLDKEAEDQKLGAQPDPAPTELRRALLKFAWSRRPEHVVWEDGAEALATKLGNTMAKEYDSSIPLVEPSEQDLKVARVAVAVAARTFSTVEDKPEVVLVRNCHVEFADKFMRKLYDGDLAYKEYSRFVSRTKLDVDVALKAIAGAGHDLAATCRALLSIRRVNPNTIGMALAMEGSEARTFISTMVRCGAARFDVLSGDKSSVVWTSQFVALLRDSERNPPTVDLRVDDF